MSPKTRRWVGIACLIAAGVGLSVFAEDNTVSYASMVPMGFPRAPKPKDRVKEIAKGSKDYKFIECDSESDCLKDLQEAELAQPVDGEKYSLVAEFVESPKKGMVVYKYPKKPKTP